MIFDSTMALIDEVLSSIGPLGTLVSMAPLYFHFLSFNSVTITCIYQQNIQNKYFTLPLLLTSQYFSMCKDLLVFFWGNGGCHGNYFVNETGKCEKMDTDFFVHISNLEQRNKFVSTITRGPFTIVVMGIDTYSSSFDKINAVF